MIEHSGITIIDGNTVIDRMIIIVVIEVFGKRTVVIVSIKIMINVHIIG